MRIVISSWEQKDIPKEIGFFFRWHMHLSERIARNLPFMSTRFENGTLGSVRQIFPIVYLPMMNARFDNLFFRWWEFLVGHFIGYKQLNSIRIAETCISKLRQTLTVVHD